MDADKFIKQLQGSKPVDVPVNHGVTKMAPANIEKIAKLLKCAFKQAVRWELIPKNPFESVILPKVDHKKRDIWTADLIRKALDNCDDPVLYVAINLSFACSLRMGEILGLTWDCVHITDADIAAENAWIFVEKELTRVTTQALSVLDQKDVIKVFPTVMCRNHFGQKPTTQLVLKKPKTESSIRRIWLPKTLALILREWHDNQERLKELIGPDYTDYGFVLAQTNGRPWEHKSIEKAFNKLKDNAELPDVVFHSLGHSSTTYKLKLNHGDLKATQGDTGHAQIDMITQIYAHILDEDRKINAQRFEEAFYAKPDLRKVEAPSQKAEETAVDLNALIAQFQQSPELLETLACLVSAKNSENARADSVQ
jgi:integrase family protein